MNGRVVGRGCAGAGGCVVDSALVVGAAATEHTPLAIKRAGNSKIEL